MTVRTTEWDTAEAFTTVFFDFQILDQVPTEPTDICPQIIVTQSNIYRNALPKGGLINE